MAEKSSRRAFLGALAAAAAWTRAKSAPAQQHPVTSSDLRPDAAHTPDIVASPVRAQLEGPTTQANQVLDGRLAEAQRIREQATRMATATEPALHAANGDEQAETQYAFSFTKGLPHDYRTGLIQRPEDFEQFIEACEAGSRSKIRSVPLGPRDGYRTVEDDEADVRGWETPLAGLAFNLIGHDPHSLSLPPAPRAGSAELTAELAEVYAQAVLRDEPLTTFRFDARADANRDEMIEALSGLSWFDARAFIGNQSSAASTRRRTKVSPQTVFRGQAPGDDVGPYLSQLLLVGSGASNRSVYDGEISYGAQTIDQRVHQVARVDFMTGWDEWFDVQNGLKPSTAELATGNRRFITTGRDLATFVHQDALYQPYLNACLALLTNGVPFDPSLPYQQDDAIDHQQGFVHYADPHVLSMLAEVCSRALKTVAFQKFNVHRRLRPEVLAARVEKAELLNIPEVERMTAWLEDTPIADRIRGMNARSSGTASLLLPMAYAEGSPMHPSYGAGHATVAGACVTVLKTFFDHTRPFDLAGDAGTAFVPTTDGARLATVSVLDAQGSPGRLTVEGELNKLAANISIARNWAGVHYYSDYWESLLLGEQVAIEIMREHMLTLPESFQLRVPRFDGSRIWI